MHQILHLLTQNGSPFFKTINPSLVQFHHHEPPTPRLPRLPHFCSDCALMALKIKPISWRKKLVDSNGISQENKNLKPGRKDAGSWNLSEFFLRWIELCNRRMLHNRGPDCTVGSVLTAVCSGGAGIDEKSSASSHVKHLRCLRLCCVNHCVILGDSDSIDSFH